MKRRAQAAVLGDGRLHLNDGPIDLIIFVDDSERFKEVAFNAAAARFATILDELCEELPYLRSPSGDGRPLPRGVVARRMEAATRPLGAARFITPMAAVAGAVADEILAAMLSAAPLRRAYVNNGGDIALHVSDDAVLKVGLVSDPDAPCIFGVAALDASCGVGGVATSGWRGRSFSLGIADAVTALAANAACADAAATLVANAVDLPGHASIVRTPANHIDPQTDLEARLVTRDVGDLSATDIVRALDRGEEEARRLIRAGSMRATSLRLGATTRVVGTLMRSEAPFLDSQQPMNGKREEGAQWRLTSASS